MLVHGCWQQDARLLVLLEFVACTPNIRISTSVVPGFMVADGQPAQFLVLLVGPRMPPIL